ncbi:hypothetical protein BDV96DRAFT_652727 [Lophiotrema nucula]|uniref:Cora-like Mg2+ transporter protein-domain-containing protein n=1 Tax=Lophiotrema nucula TaxID=690887 RepID=A0A6A5YMW9_9PLEO|nr:hypothetical protein BDV96DRAFT_652727 [Lophiotrema nucula]
MANVPSIRVEPQSFLTAPDTIELPERPPSIRSGSNRQWSPEQYTSLIAQYAKRNSTLYSGVHFTKLANLLRKPFERPNKRLISREHIPTTESAALYTVGPGTPFEYRHIRSPEDLIECSEEDVSSMLFLRGQPCPEWLAYAGASYHIDPEFFQRHLDFLLTMSRKRYFAYPPLISASRNIIQLSYMTVGECSSQGGDIDQAELDDLRMSSDMDMRHYFNLMSKGISQTSSPADSIVRDYFLLDKDHFVIHQQVSVYIAQRDKGWANIIWLDTGNPLSADQSSPWGKIIAKNQSNHQETFLPWIQTHPFAALRATSLSITPDRRPSKDMQQSASLLHLDYGKTLDKQLLVKDPYYALHELFTACANSNAQFLTVLASKIAQDAARKYGPDENVSPTNMIYYQHLLDSLASSIRNTLLSMQNRDQVSWQKATEPTLRSKAATAAQTLAQDYQELIRRTETLSEGCKTRLHVLMNRAAIVESNKAIEQAKEVTKLTRLAFVFIPLGFISSFFGMNLSPFSNNAPYGLWIFFAVSAPLVVLMLLSIIWSPRKALLKVMRKKENRKERKSFEDEESG